MRASSPAMPGLNKLAGEVVEVTLTLSLTLRSQQYGILKYTRDPLLNIVPCALMGRYYKSHKVKKGPKWGILHIRVQVRPKMADCNDFCHSKNLKFPPPP